MNNVLSVKNLSKHYPSFVLDHISFDVHPGEIVGFIGRNGAGKSTTINAMFNIIHTDEGEVIFFGKPFKGNETEIKRNVGLVYGAGEYYPSKKLKTITSTVSMFYPDFDWTTYHQYMSEFQLEENKTIHQLSCGMKVKYSLVLALSHHARFLVLDEPTSGLDPSSRDEILDIFLTLKERGVAILFSTHITSDLDKCADRILYLVDGKLMADETYEGFKEQYRLIQVSKSDDVSIYLPYSQGIRRSRDGFTILVKSNCPLLKGDEFSPDLEEIMIHLGKGHEND